MKFNKWGSLPFCLAGLCVLALSVSTSLAQTAQVDVFPKYIVLGVVYAPPGSASNVIYTNSTQVGSTVSVMEGSSNQQISTSSSTVGGGLFGLGATQTNTTTDGFTTGASSTDGFTIETTQGNSISTMGPISSSLGVNHDNDVIYILLNPAMTDFVGYNTSTGAVNSVVWNGLFSNGCDLTDSNDSPTFYQRLSGCDANQFPYPDIVGIPVWCLKNPYYPGQGCAQWMAYTSRSWDQSYRGPAIPITSTANYSTISAYPMNPINPAGLTLQDYADILQADPFVAVNGSAAAANSCHPLYGPDFDPNDSETVGTPTNLGSVYSTLVASGVASGSVYTSAPTVTFSTATGTNPVTATGTANMNPAGTAVASITITKGGSGYTAAHPPTITFTGGGVTTANQAVAYAYLTRVPSVCGTSNSFTMNRFQPYGTVEYPVPGPNGLPSTYTGTFEYSDTSQASSTTTDSHTYGSSTDTTYGFNQSIGLSINIIGVSLGSFEDEVTSGNSNTMTSQYSNTVGSSTTSSDTAGYTITGPQLSDNYTGPSTYSVYLDNIYGTYAFYSPMEPKPTLGTIAITSGVASPAAASTPLAPLPSSAIGATLVAGSLIPITLTNNAIYPLTMAGPAVTFSDPGFVLFEPGNYPSFTNAQNYPDGCSNQQLLAYGQTSGGQTYYCTVYILFAPQYSDAPNPVTLANSPSVQATLVAAGTENIDSFENILITGQSAVSAVVTGATQGATLLPTGVSQNSLTAANPLPYIYTFGSTTLSTETEPFTFNNNYSTPVTVSQISLTNADYLILNGSSDTCLNQTVPAGGTCGFTVQFSPPTTFTGMVDTAIYLDGTVPAWYGSQVYQLADAGAVGPGQAGVSFSPAYIQANGTNEEGPGCGDQEPGGGYTFPPCGWLNGNAPTGSIAIANTTQYTATVTITTLTNSPLSLVGTSCASVVANSTCYQEVLSSVSCNPSTDQNAGQSYNTCTVSSGVLPAFQITATLNESGTNVTEFTNQPITGSSSITYNWYFTPEDVSVVPITIHGVEQSTATTVPATAATASLTVQSVSTAVVASASTAGGPAPAASGPAPATGSPSAKLTLAVKVGSFQTTVQTPAGSTAATVAQAVAKALTVLGSPVKATASGAVVTMTSYTKGSAANVAFTVTGNADFTVASSGSALAGGKNATTSTKYDAGLVNLTTNGVTASARWGEGSTPATVAQALAASVNTVASAYWTATASGDVVTLTGVSSSSAAKGKSPVTLAASIKSSVSKTANTAAAPSVVVTTSDTAGFTPASFGAATN